MEFYIFIKQGRGLAIHTLSTDASARRLAQQKGFLSAWRMYGHGGDLIQVF